MMAVVTPSAPSTFFSLPRELRDLIYHHLWRCNPALQNSSSRFSTVCLQLRYDGRYSIEPQKTSWGYENGVNDNIENRRLPLGLAANKQLLHEALEQFLSRAEWFWDEDNVEKEQTWTSSLLDASGVKDVTLYFGAFLGICETCTGDPHVHGWWSHDAELVELAEGLSKDESGIRRLRIAGWTQCEREDEEYQHAMLLAQSYGYVARRAKAERLELSLWHDDSETRRVYEVLGEKEGFWVVPKTNENFKDETSEIVLACR